VTGFSPRIHRFQASHTLPLPRYSNALHSHTKHKPRIPTLPRGRVLSSSNDPDCTVEPQTSLSGVSYEDVQTELERLYPSEGIDQRNALSRTDGYWKFIQRGEDPPMQFTYGVRVVVFSVFSSSLGSDETHTKRIGVFVMLATFEYSLVDVIYFVFMCCAFWEQNIILLRFVCKNINCFCCCKVVIHTYIYSLIFRCVCVCFMHLFFAPWMILLTVFVIIIF